ncbi:hypothetical protein BX616_005098 [Lobosporangium transversale]|nr:hypothetical protein BX616_005098 [Lobosporangium transversale]
MIFTLCINDQLTFYSSYYWPGPLQVHQLLITPPSPHTNPLLGIVQLGDQGLTCLVVPYHPLGNLRRYIADQRANLTAIQQMQLIHDIASGLEFLHQRGIHHLNLHSANVLITLQGMAILTDVGRANNRAEVGMPPKPTVEQERVRSLAVVFLAPEILASNSYSSRSDVYALGMVMFELLTGRVAFEKDLDRPGLSTKVMFGRQDEIPANIKGSPGPAYEALIKDCWKLNPAERPHLSGLKNRLEQLMAECRQKAEALKLQHQAALLQQQLLYQQQQQAQYNQLYQPGSIAPPTPPLPDGLSVDPMLQANAITARIAASNAAQAAAQAAATSASSSIITTQVVVSNTTRPRADSSARSISSNDSTTKEKPVEAWTIGHATAPSTIQQRDAIPIPTRALELTSTHLRSRSVSPLDQQLFSTTSLGSVPLSTSSVASIIAPVTSIEPNIALFPPAQNGLVTLTTASTTSTAMANTSQSSALSTGLPLPPNINSPIPISNAGPGVVAPLIITGATTNIPLQLSTIPGLPSSDAKPYPLPPPIRSSSASNSSKILSEAYTNPGAAAFTPATISTASAANNATIIPVLPITTAVAVETSAGTSYGAGVDVGNASSLVVLSPVTPMSPVSPTSSTASSMSPNSLFNPGRNTIIATSAAEQQSQNDPMATFFSWAQAPRFPVGKDEVKRKISSASSSVKLIEDGYTTPSNSDTDHPHHSASVSTATSISTTKSPMCRCDKVKSLIAAIEHPSSVETGNEAGAETAAMLAIPAQAEDVLPSSTGTDLQQLQKQLCNSPPISPISTLSYKQSSESILIIPIFPEPPTTLHNRRISNIDIQFRQAARQHVLSQSLMNERMGSISNDESSRANGSKKDSKTLTSVRSPEAMTPQISGPGSATAGLVTRSSYMPITSSGDVPMSTPSDCIFSAAKNGDLEELQYFLNKALSRSLSNGSTSSASVHSGSNNTARNDLNVSVEPLDQVEPVERLPVLCCAAVARKNKYQALSMVLRAGANVEAKEQRGGNTPLHLVCETAPPPLEEPTVIRYKQDENGSRICAEDVLELMGPKMSQLLDSNIVVPSSSMGEAEELGEEKNYGDLSSLEERQAAALRKVIELDELEQEAMERVRMDLGSLLSISTNEDGAPNSSGTLQKHNLGGTYRALMKGGLEDQIRLLVLAGSPVDTPNLRGETPLLLLLRFHDSVMAMATLLRLGADPTHMSPFGPGADPPEIHIDPSLLPGGASSKEYKRSSKRLFSIKSAAAGTAKTTDDASSSTTTSLLPENDPNHILVMHGGALVQAAYYLRFHCLHYLLENEIECSDPVIIEQAIVACRQSTAAKVNPPLVTIQKRILKTLEKDWKGETGRRRRILVAERTLDRKQKPIRSKVLLVALSVSSGSAVEDLGGDTSTEVSIAGTQHSNGFSTNTANNGAAAAASFSGSRVTRSEHRRGGASSSSSTFAPAALKGIPTTHLYASKGPSGPEIELVGQHGFVVDSSTSRYHLSDRPVPSSLYPLPTATSLTPAFDTISENGSSNGSTHSKELQDFYTVVKDQKGFFRKIRGMAKRS